MMLLGIFIIFGIKMAINNFIKDFVIKGSIKGKIGTFSIKEGQLTQKLNMYKVSDKKFIKF